MAIIFTVASEKLRNRKSKNSRSRPGSKTKASRTSSKPSHTSHPLSGSSPMDRDGRSPAPSSAQADSDSTVEKQDNRG